MTPQGSGGCGGCSGPPQSMVDQRPAYDSRSSYSRKLKVRRPRKRRKGKFY